ncbi:hypothetical protein EZS27_012346 [termite gut metagenome]|uniref:Uncharacterized protein n=1 Tax=termite gut metagenome TaxID=433724 RepID=A0A5J4S1Y8_9ZZZZ
MNQSTNETELLDKRKKKLLCDLKSVRHRLHEVALCLQRPGALTREQYCAFADEHNALVIRKGNIERCLYQEFRMTDKQINKELTDF